MRADLLSTTVSRGNIITLAARGGDDEEMPAFVPVIFFVIFFVIMALISSAAKKAKAAQQKQQLADRKQQRRAEPDTVRMPAGRGWEPVTPARAPGGGYAPPTSVAPMAHPQSQWEGDWAHAEDRPPPVNLQREAASALRSVDQAVRAGVSPRAAEAMRTVDHAVGHAIQHPAPRKRRRKKPLHEALRADGGERGEAGVGGSRGQASSRPEGGARHGEANLASDLLPELDARGLAQAMITKELLSPPLALRRRGSGLPYQRG